MPPEILVLSFLTKTSINVHGQVKNFSHTLNLKAEMPTYKFSTQKCQTLKRWKTNYPKWFHCLPRKNRSNVKGSIRGFIPRSTDTLCFDSTVGANPVTSHTHLLFLKRALWMRVVCSLGWKCQRQQEPVTKLTRQRLPYDSIMAG